MKVTPVHRGPFVKKSERKAFERIKTGSIAPLAMRRQRRRGMRS